MANPGGDSFEVEPAPGMRAYLLVFLLPLAVGIGIAVLACQTLIASERERLRGDWLGRLEATAAQSAETARLWFFERRMDADVLADNPITRRALGGAGETNAEALADLALTLERLRASYGYTEVFVIDVAGEVVAAAPSVAIDPSVKELAARTAQTQRPQIAIVDDGMHLAFTSPVRGANKGAVVLEMEPRTALHPRLATPTRTSTGETILVGGSRDGVVLLSPRRYGPDPFRPLTVAPAEGTPFAAALDAEGDAPGGDYIDYRRHAVLAVMRRVDAAGFGVAVKIDRDEALAPLGGYRTSVYSIAGLALVALAGVAGTLRQQRRASRLRAEVTRQQQSLAVRRVEERAARLGRALDEASDELYVLDAPTLRIVETNARARVATGFDAEALNRMTVHDLQPQEDEGQREIAALLAALSQGQRQYATYSTSHRRADGSSYPVEVRVQRADIGAEPALVMLATDATARRDMQAQLVQAQKMEAVGRLAGGIAHDFNNLLTVMLVSLDSLKNGVSPGSSLHEEAEEALTAAKRAAELTHQLLSFSRKQTLQPAVVDVNAAVRGFLRLLQRALREDITLDLSLTPLPTWVRVDRGQLEQSLLNLVGNARDAMPNGGRVTLETGLSDATGAPRDLVLPAERCVVLRVRDTGIGMDEETLRHAFDPFFTTKPIGSGTGLGLAMVYGFVQQSGGAIHATSRPGVGTTVEIFFPAAPAPEQRASAPPSVAPHARGETVLVVDDSPQVRNIAARALRAQGYRVLEAAGGAEAIRVFEEHIDAIALLLSDVAMPNMDGRALADALHTRAPTLPVLFMSGYSDDAVLREAPGPGNEAFLGKPFTPERLAEAVRTLLDRHR